MPTWLLLVVMSLGTYRGTRLVVADTFPPVLWLRDRMVGGWRPLTEPEQEALDERIRTGGPFLWEWQDIDGERHRYLRRAQWSPYWLAELLSCPWCASGWIGLAVTAGVWATVGLAVPVLCWFSAWAVGGILAAQDWA